MKQVGVFVRGSTTILQWWCLFGVPLKIPNGDIAQAEENSWLVTWGDWLQKWGDAPF